MWRGAFSVYVAGLTRTGQRLTLREWGGNPIRLRSVASLRACQGPADLDRHRQGRHATVRETDLRAELRALGFADSKSCAVSDRLTATRYAERKG